jgi:hypothetical protein
MKLISLTIARNSAWSIEAVIGHALQYVDSAVVLLHASTDDTLKKLQRMDDRVTIAKLPEQEWNEMQHRQLTLNIGRDLGGTHFVILDDDEFLTQNLVPHVRGMCEQLKPGQLIRQPMRCCWRSLDQYRSDRGNPFTECWKSVAFVDTPAACWETKDGYQHHHTHPYGITARNVTHPNGGGWLHIQHANWKRLVTKQVWYMCMEIVRYGAIRANYQGTMDETDLELSPVPKAWWSAFRNKLHLKAEPWQAEDLSRMVKQHGADFFASRGVDVLPVLKGWGYVQSE